MDDCVDMCVKISADLITNYVNSASIMAHSPISYLPPVPSSSLDPMQEMQLRAAREQLVAGIEQAQSSVEPELLRDVIDSMTVSGRAALRAGGSLRFFRSFFSLFDTDGDGKLSKTEMLGFYKAALDLRANFCTDTQIALARAGLKLLDHDNDGVLKEEDMLLFISKLIDIMASVIPLFFFLAKTITLASLLPIMNIAFRYKKAQIGGSTDCIVKEELERMLEMWKTFIKAQLAAQLPAAGLAPAQGAIDESPKVCGACTLENAWYASTCDACGGPL